MPRVVIDTNVIISSIFWKNGNPHKITLLAIEQKIQNFTSQDMINELAKVLKVDFKQPDEYAERQVNLLLAYSEIAEPQIKVKAVHEDPKDNMILECALGADAEFVITGDNHLLKLKNFKGIKILTPKEFLDLI